MLTMMRMFLDGGTSMMGLPAEKPDLKEPKSKSDKEEPGKPSDEKPTDTTDSGKNQDKKSEEKLDEKKAGEALKSQIQTQFQKQNEFLKENYPEVHKAAKEHVSGKKEDKKTEEKIPGVLTHKEMIAKAKEGLDMDEDDDKLVFQSRLNELQMDNRDRIKAHKERKDRQERETTAVQRKIKEIAATPMLASDGKTPLKDDKGNVMPLYPPEIVKQAAEMADSYESTSPASAFRAFCNSLNHLMLLHGLSATKAQLYMEAEQKARQVANQEQPAGTSGIDSKEKTPRMKDIEKLEKAAGNRSIMSILQGQ